MTDIPVGSPPVPPGRHAAPGGWYADPLDAAKERYWDGWQWSRNTRALDGGPAGGAPAAPGQSPPSPQGQPSGGLYGPGGQYGQGQYGQGQYGQPQYGQPHSGQGQYGQGQYGQPQYGQPQYGQGQTSGPEQGAQYPPGAEQPDPYQTGGYPPDPHQPDPYQQGPYQQGPYQQGPYQPQPGQGFLQNQPGAKAVVTADGVPLAGWWSRVLAIALDGFIVGAIAAIPSFPIYGRLFAAFSAFFEETMRTVEAGQPAPPTPDLTAFISATDQLLLTLISVAVGLAYNIFFVRRKGATPGKMACRLRIVPVDQGRHTGALPWNTVLIRVAIWVLPGIQGFLMLFKAVDALFPLWHPKRQALHDLAAKTQVVKVG